MKKNIIRLLNFIMSLFGRKIAHSSHFLAPTTEGHRVLKLIESLRPKSIETPLVRLGPTGDGGYLIPEDLNGITACFSPGVSEISGFEKSCADLGMGVFLADKSVLSPAQENPQFSFIRKFIGSFADDDFITMDKWVSDSVPDDGSDLILQMDIEGFEYEVIMNMSKSIQERFRIIVIEFHYLDQLWNAPYFEIVSRAFEKLLRTHTCVHIHPNNYAELSNFNGVPIPPLLEITFLRNDRVRLLSQDLSFPHPLDADNTSNKSLVLPALWYRN